MSSGYLLCHITAARVYQQPSLLFRQHMFLFTLQLAWRFPSPNLLAFSCCLASSSKLYIFEYKEECLLLPSNPSHFRFFLPKPLFSHSCEKTPERNNLQEERSFLAWDSEALQDPCSRDGGSWWCPVGSSQETEVRPAQKRLQPFSPAPQGPTSSSSAPLLKDPTGSPKRCHKLGTKCSNMEPIREYFTSNATPPLQLVSFGLVRQTHGVFGFFFVWASPILPT